MARLSVLGMYDYDNALFDGLQLPTAADITNDAEKVANPWIPNKQELIEYLLMECAELEVLRPSVPTLKKMIGIWSKARQPVWKALYNTMLYKYNPIWNKDGLVKETRDLDGKNERTANLKTADTRTYTNLTDEHTLTNLTNTQTGAVEHDVTGYNSDSYSPNTRDNYNQVKNVGTGSEKNVRNGEDKNIEEITGTDKYYTEDNGTITREESGNIGVTSTQELIERQRDIAMFNLYDVIVQEFKSRFCLLVY